METTQVSTSGLIDKQNVVCIYEGTLFHLKNQRHSATWARLESVMLREVRLSQPGKYCGSTCLRALRVVKFIETENRMVRARGWVQEQAGMGSHYQWVLSFSWRMWKSPGDGW